MSRAMAIEERAACWVLRREEPSWSAADEAELEAWLAESDAHKAAYWRLEHGWREADRIAALGAPASPAAYGFGAPAWSRPVALAASLLLVFTLILLQSPSLPWGGMEQASTREFATSVGGHKIVSLPDRSRVELNTDTAIKTTVDNRRRAVWLERGEAFFDVAKLNGQQFVIYAGERTITVLGTKFSVRRSADEVVVAVLEGKVRVEDASKVAPGRDATVSAGDVAIARGASTLVTNSTEAVQQQLAWRRGLISFDGVTLASAAEQFNRYNRKQLVIADSMAAQTIVGGSFLARNVDAFARLVEQAYGLDARQSAGRIVLSSRRMASRAPLKQLRPELVGPPVKSDSGDAAEQCGPGGGNCAVIPLSPPAQDIQTASAANIKAVRDAKNWNVLHKLYPPRALAAGEEGLVGFTVKIDARGNPTQCRITHTSGHPLLDLETCKLIMVHASFKRPDGASRSQQRSYEGVVNWKLPTTPLAAVPDPPKPLAAAAAPEELICKRTRKIGSNAAYERKCMSKSDWDRTSKESQEFLEELQRQ